MTSPMPPPSRSNQRSRLKPGQITKLVSLVAFSAVAALGCVSDDASPPESQPADSDIAEVLQSLHITGERFLKVEATGTRYEPLQGQRPEDAPLVSSIFEMSATHDETAEQIRIHWQRQTFEPIIAEREYDEIVSGDVGFSNGSDVIFGFADSRPLTSDRIAPVRRQQHLLHPRLLVAKALSDGRSIRPRGEEEIAGVPHLVIEIAAQPAPIQMYINLSQRRISQVTTIENDHPMGDVEIRVRFSDWRLDKLPVAYPHRAVMYWDGKILHEEERREVTLVSSVPDDTFTLPAQLLADPDEFERGLASSQWTQRALGIGAPLHLEQRNVVALTIRPDMVLFTGGSHYSLAIAQATGVIVIDPPLFEERSIPVIEAIKETWPKKPITHIIVSHHHHDHSGGVRTYAAEDAAIVINAGDRDFVEELLARPHSLRPDRLAENPTAPKLITVGTDPLTLGSGDTELVLYRVANAHAAENLIAYFPAHKLLFNADLYIPLFFPPDTALPPPFDRWALDLRASLVDLGLDIDWMLGPHGSPEPRPFSEFLSQAALSE